MSIDEQRARSRQQWTGISPPAKDDSMPIGRKSTHDITVSKSTILIGRATYEQAKCPRYVFATWDADHVTLHREEDYEAKGQGIYKVFLSGNGAGTPRIDSKRVVEGAGLVSGRYLVTHVDEDRITFSKTPLPAAEPVAPPTQAAASGDTPLVSLNAVAERTGVTVMQLRHDMNAGLLHPVMLPPEQVGRQRIAGIEEAEVERFRRWRVKYRGASYPDIGPEDLDGI